MVIFFFFFFARAWPPPTPEGHRWCTGALLEAMRSEAGLSLQQLADLITEGGYRTSKAGLYKYEQGNRPAPLEVFDAAGAACGFDLGLLHAVRVAGLVLLQPTTRLPPEQDDPARPNDVNRAELVAHFRERLPRPNDSAEPVEPALESPGRTLDAPRSVESPERTLDAPQPVKSPESDLASKEQHILDQLRSSSAPSWRAIRVVPPLDPDDTLHRLVVEANPIRRVTLVTSSRKAAGTWQRRLGSLEHVEIRTSWEVTPPAPGGGDEPGAPRLLLFDGIDAIRPLGDAIRRGKFRDTYLVIVASALDGVSERTLFARKIEIEEVGHLRDSFRARALAGFRAHLLLADDHNRPKGRGRRPEAAPEDVLEGVMEHLELWSSPGRLVILAGADKPAGVAADMLRRRSREVSLVGRRTLAGPTDRAFRAFESNPNGVLCLGRRVRRLDPLPPVSRVCILSPIHSGRLEEHVLPFLAASAESEPVCFDELVLGDPDRRIRAWKRLIQEGTSEMGVPGVLRFSPFPPR
jgi:hypothetical protein